MLSFCSNHQSPRTENTLAKLINENLFAKILIYVPGTSGCLKGNLKLWALHCVNLEAIFLNVKYLLHEKKFGAWSRSPVIYGAFGEGLLGWTEIIFQRLKANPLFEIALCIWKGDWTKLEGQPSIFLCLVYKIVFFQTFYNQAYTNLSLLHPAPFVSPLLMLLLPLSHPLKSSSRLCSDRRQINPAGFIHVGFCPHNTLP